MEQGQTDAPTEQVASEVVTEQASPETAVEQAPVAPMAPVGERKKSNGAIIGMVIFALVALGGVGFGVWQMMQGSSKDKQIADLKTQVTNCANANNDSTENVTVTCPDGTEVEVEETVLKNPVIKATEPQSYSVVYHKTLKDISTSDKLLSVHVSDGQVSYCLLGNDECTFSGATGSIFKIVDIYEGNGLGSEKIGFIMEDGSVLFSPLYNDNEINRDFQLRKAKIDGFVKDAIFINFIEDTSNPIGYGSTVFILGDNSILKYSASMFE